MELKKFVKLAFDLKEKHGLANWKIDTDNATRRLGRCNYQTKTLSFSWKLAQLNNEEICKETILHEIAHALAGPKAGHGMVWKTVALSIGSNGEKTAKHDEVIRPGPQFQAECPGCKITFKAQRRRKVACRKCCNGLFDSKFLFIWKIV